MASFCDHHDNVTSHAFCVESLLRRVQGDGSSAASLNNYLSVPVFVDEIVPGSSQATTTLRQSIALPTTASGSQLACTLTASQYAHEGFASVSLDGSTLMLGCYNAAVSGSNYGYQTSSQRVIARVFANGEE